MVIVVIRKKLLSITFVMKDPPKRCQGQLIGHLYWAIIRLMRAFVGHRALPSGAVGAQVE